MEISNLLILQKKGVNIPNPESVYISNDINPDRISSDNVTLHSGTKLMGKRTLIQDNVTIGLEAPVCLEDTLVGKNSRLNGGYFNNTVCLGHNIFGSGAHVRKGTILEEQANAAHTVGLKQTILFPFVTLGSLINFCDCLMAGGTSRKDHSEVGSSFIHFNYTPNQDKATPSMMGDVHNGVMLSSKPIFLGGQGGLVGPVRINYGCITAAGSIIRKNQLDENRLVMGGSFKEMSMPRKPQVYSNIQHIFNSNIYYIAGLIALKSWYHHVRPLFVQNELDTLLIEGLQENLYDCIHERIKRFNGFCDNLKISKDILASQKNIPEAQIKVHEQALKMTDVAMVEFSDQLKDDTVPENGLAFIQSVKQKIKKDSDYINVIQSLSKKEKGLGIQWLFKIQKSLIDHLFI